ncbi:MAG: hypothetical protein KAQ98_10520 [Bacteriovoracaceae bacterium]|nr:hypothetical protein [Bacteriovoracaceae bacterium]
MKNQDQVKAELLKLSVEKKGKKFISCSNASKVAEQFNIEKTDVGRICNQENIKMEKCQFGFF